MIIEIALGFLAALVLIWAYLFILGFLVTRNVVLPGILPEIVSAGALTAFLLSIKYVS